MSVTQTLSGTATSNFRSRPRRFSRTGGVHRLDVDHDRRLAAITSGAAPVADLRLDPRQLRQSGNAVRTNAFALFDQIVMQLAVALDLAALGPSLLQQFGLAPVLPHARWLSGVFSHA